jgi:hypothetical protein
MMKTRRVVGDGPEAELSGEEEEDGASVAEEDVLVGDVGGKSAPKSEVSMGALLDGAKVRPGRVVPISYLLSLLPSNHFQSSPRA